MNNYIVVRQFRANRMKTYFVGDIISESEYNVIPDGPRGCRCSEDGPKEEFCHKLGKYLGTYPKNNECRCHIVGAECFHCGNVENHEV